jgi:hypothetical protein
MRAAGRRVRDVAFAARTSGLKVLEIDAMVVVVYTKNMRVKREYCSKGMLGADVKPRQHKVSRFKPHSHRSGVCGEAKSPHHLPDESDSGS